MRKQKNKLVNHQGFMKSKFTNQVERHSPRLELCMDYAFGSFGKIHGSSSDAVSLHEVVKSLKELLPTVTSGDERKLLSDELDKLVTVHTQYVGHLIRTKHQAHYYKFILKNLQSG